MSKIPPPPATIHIVHDVLKILKDSVPYLKRGQELTGMSFSKNDYHYGLFYYYFTRGIYSKGENRLAGLRLLFLEGVMGLEDCELADAYREFAKKYVLDFPEEEEEES